jgi:hypothetical protein
MTRHAEVIDTDMSDAPLNGPEAIVEALREALPKIKAALEDDDFNGELVSSMTLLPSTKNEAGEIVPAGFVAQVITVVKMVTVTAEEAIALRNTLALEEARINAANLDNQATAPGSATPN